MISVSAGYGTDGFLQLGNNIGADKIISVNYGSGSVQEAAAWVNYCNIIHNSNVLYWNVGNEVYHQDEYDLHQYRHDAYTYAGFVRDCHVQMKAVDSRIKIGVEGGYDEYSSPQRISVTNPRTGEIVNGWAPVLLSTPEATARGNAELAGMGDGYTFADLRPHIITNSSVEFIWSRNSSLT